MLFRKTKKNQPKLDDETAAVMLGNIFDACDKEPNTVPLSVLLSYSNYRKDRFILQKVLLLLVFLLFCMVPFLFVPPTFEVSASNIGSNKDPIYEILVESTLIPISRVTATMGGHNIPVYETDSHVYQVQPEANGELLVSVTLSNHHTNTTSIMVQDVYVKTPVLLSNRQEGDTIHLYVEDVDSGIDYANVYAVDHLGKKFFPRSCNEETGEIIFDYPEDPLNIYVPDNADNVLHLILTVY